MQEIPPAELRSSEEILVASLGVSYLYGILTKFPGKMLQEIHSKIESNSCVNNVITSRDQYATVSLNGVNFRVEIIADLQNGLRAVELLDVGVTKSVFVRELRPIASELFKYPRMSVKVALKSTSLRESVQVGEILKLRNPRSQDGVITDVVVEGGTLIPARRLLKESRFTRRPPTLNILGKQRVKIVSLKANFLHGTILERNLRKARKLEEDLQRLGQIVQIDKVSINDFVLVVLPSGRKFRAIVENVEDEKCSVEDVDTALVEEVSLRHLFELPEELAAIAAMAFSMHFVGERRCLAVDSLYDVVITGKSDLKGRVFAALFPEQRRSTSLARIAEASIPGAGCSMRVIVNSMSSPPTGGDLGRIHGVQIADSLDIAFLERQLGDIQLAKHAASDADIGDFVLVDSDRGLRRALVLTKNVCGDLFSVIHIDYGSRAQVPIESMYELFRGDDDQYDKLREIPQCSFQCTVQGQDLSLNGTYEIEFLNDATNRSTQQLGIPSVKMLKVIHSTEEFPTLNAPEENGEPSEMKEGVVEKNSRSIEERTEEGSPSDDIGSETGCVENLSPVDIQSEPVTHHGIQEEGEEDADQSSTIRKRFARNPLVAKFYGDEAEQSSWDAVVVAVGEERPGRSSSVVTLRIPRLTDECDKLFIASNDTAMSEAKLKVLFASRIQSVPPAVVRDAGTWKRAIVIGRPSPTLLRLFLVDHGICINRECGQTYACPESLFNLPIASVHLRIDDLDSRALRPGQAVSVVASKSYIGFDCLPNRCTPMSRSGD